MNKQTIQDFATKVTQEIKDDPFFADYPAGADKVITVKFGRKYAKLLSDNGGSVWAFVDMITGDLLKAASWATPAKHARGNIETAQYGRNYSWLGPNYLR